MPFPLDTSKPNSLALLKGYKTESAPGVLDKKATVELFDDDTKTDFYPAMRVRAWGGECSFRIDLPRSGENFKTATQTVDVKNGQDQLTVVHGDVTHKIYSHVLNDEDDDNGFEWDIILATKPLSKILEFKFQSEGLSFLYQGELTAEEIADGATRPINVVKSYAVYHDSKANNHRHADGTEDNYKTGKFCHIDNPELVDALGNRARAESFFIDPVVGIMRITCPQSFLDTAIYPVIIDPDIGYTSVGGTADSQTANRAHGMAKDANTYVASSGDEVTSVSLYAYSTSGTPSMGTAVYDTIINGTRNELTDRLTAVQTHNLTTTQEWVTVSGLTDSMTDSVRYSIAWGEHSTLDGSIQMKFDSDATARDRQTAGGDTLGASWNHQSFRDTLMSVFFTYTAGGGAFTLTADKGTFTLSGITLTALKAGRKIAPVKGTFTLSGIDTGLVHGRTMPADLGTFTLSGITLDGLFTGRMLGAAVGSFTHTGIDADLVHDAKLVVTVGTFSLTGIDVGFPTGKAMIAETGVFTLSGITLDGLFAGRKVNPVVGAFSLTGIDVDLIYSGDAGAFTLTADKGTFILTGITTGLVHGRIMPAAVGTFVHTGITLDGLFAGRKVNPVVGIFTLTGITTGLIRDAKLVTAVGTFTHTGIDAGLGAGRMIGAGTGTFTHTGIAAALAAGRKLAAAVGPFILTGIDVTLTYGQVGVQQFEELFITDLEIKVGDIDGLEIKTGDIDDFTVN